MILKCEHCGTTVQEDKLSSVRTLRAVRHVAPGDCEPEERVSQCLNCYETDCFVEASRCEACDQYECKCGEQT